MSTEEIEIDPKMLWLARGLALAAYSGFILVLPTAVAGKIIEAAERVTADIVGTTLRAWADEIDTVLDRVAS